MDTLRKSDWGVTGKWFVLASFVGVVAGLGAVAFQFVCQLVAWSTLGFMAGYAPPEPAGEHRRFEMAESTFQPWMLVVVAVGGGLASGLIVFTFAPEAEGHGTDNVIDAYHHKRGRIRARVPLVKMLASAITIGTGGSGGREGPIAQIGAGFGSNLASALRLSARDRRILMAAGMGAGIGAIFRAPLAGALFAAEILYRDADIESEVIVPAALASIMSFVTFSLFMPAELRNVPLFGSDLHYVMTSLWELLPLTVMALVLTAASWLYVNTFYGVVKITHRVPIVPHVKPAIGAGLAALIGVGMFYFFGQNKLALGVLSTGYGTLEVALSQAASAGAGLLCAVALLKIVTTSLTISTGGSGGVFGPSMVIGGCLGAACGLVFQSMWPDVVTQPEAFAIVGMAGFFAGSARAPISTVIMVSEITGDYGLLLPTLWVSTLCFLLCSPWTLYHMQVTSRLDSPAHRGELLADVLAGLRVADVPLKQRQVVSEAATLPSICESLAESTQDYFPVVDADGGLVGIFSIGDVRAYLDDRTLWPLAIARDVMTTELIKLTSEDDLNTAMKRFTQLNVEEIPVVETSDPKRLLGMLRRKDVLSAYNRKLFEHQKDVAEHA
ncbi:MAG: chloride channel protein [Planctomyces sp.]|nr:chloride channel protein [Planctomyces sp.]